MYAENESDNLMELIQEEEKRLSDLKEEFQFEISQARSINPNKVKEIKRVSDVWENLNNQEKNKVLKKCVDRVVIKGEEVEVYFSI